jgi:RNA polymerase subunit RPABC4/transcription elongation factor Spt4
MAKWVSLPAEPLRYQPEQKAFWQAIKDRVCRKCKTEFTVVETKFLCPKCSSRGFRKWDRLTIIAGRRFGKTRGGSIAGAFEATIPNSLGWACAPSNQKLHRYVIPAFQQLIPEDWVADWSTEYLDLKLKNGSLIHFQTLEHPDQGRGQGLDWLWIDEVCELSRAHWEVIRPSLAGDTVAFFTTSPRGYDWVYDELYKPAEDGLPGYWGCHAKTAESANPRISAEFLARERAQMSDAMYRQEYEADFVIFTGAVYGGLVDPQILRTSEEIKKLLPEWPAVDPSRPALIGIDTGADHPFGAIKLVSTEAGLIAVGEYLERNRPFIQHASSLKMMAGYSPVKWAINKNERQQTIELAQHGIFCQKAENDIIAGTERVKSWLLAKQLWLVEQACPLTIRQLKAYRWADNETRKEEKRSERVFKKDDELPDCLRYALMTWPVLPKHVEPKDKPRDISHLPWEARAAIERMRKIDKPQSEEPESIIGDFWS